MSFKEKIAYQAKHIDYIETLDSTLTGSRNSMAPILLRYNIATHGKGGFCKKAEEMLEMSDYACERLSELEYNAWKNELEITVIFDRPDKWIIRKWSLSPPRQYVQLFTMPS
ncbi:MAG: hypothetical protein MK132_02705 [Lentisphaerales bacterium]|nr:hypothetical protein [Lentisphaerales bacterium]